MIFIFRSTVTRQFLSIVFFLCLFNYSSFIYAAASGYISARLDSVLQTEQTADATINKFEEQLALQWRSIEGELLLVSQLDLRYQDSDPALNSNYAISDSLKKQVNQFFLAHEIKIFKHSLKYRIGRYLRSDRLGYYAIDGLLLEYYHKNWKASAYSGKPLKIENYYKVDAASITGLKVNSINSINTLWVKKISSYIAWQHISNKELNNYIYWGLTSENKKNINNDLMPAKNAISLLFNGSYSIESSSIEYINAGLNITTNKRDKLRLAFSNWKPQAYNLSFKQRFYSVYARAEQSVFLAEYFKMTAWDKHVYIRTRKVLRHNSDNGFGLSAGYKNNQQRASKYSWVTQWDGLALRDKSIQSFYFNLNKNISSLFSGHLSIALQYKKNLNQTASEIYAIEMGTQYMLASKWILNLNARFIANDIIENESRVNLRMSYRFNAQT